MNFEIQKPKHFTWSFTRAREGFISCVEIKQKKKHFAFSLTDTSVSDTQYTDSTGRSGNLFFINYLVETVVVLGQVDQGDEPTGGLSTVVYCRGSAYDDSEPI